MKTQSSALIRVAAILLLVLTIGSALVELTRYYGDWNQRPFSPARSLPRSRLERPGERDFPARPGESRQGLPDQPAFPGSANWRWFLGFSLARAVRRLAVYWHTGLIAVSILAAVGLWLQKSWGKVFAVLTVVLVWITSLPTLLVGFFRLGGTILETGIKILLTIAVLVLLFLPTSQGREQPSL